MGIRGGTSNSQWSRIVFEAFYSGEEKVGYFQFFGDGSKKVYPLCSYAKLIPKEPHQQQSSLFCNYNEKKCHQSQCKEFHPTVVSPVLIEKQLAGEICLAVYAKNYGKFLCLDLDNFRAVPPIEPITENISISVFRSFSKGFHLFIGFDGGRKSVEELQHLGTVLVDWIKELHPDFSAWAIPGTTPNIEIFPRSTPKSALFGSSLAVPEPKRFIEILPNLKKGGRRGTGDKKS